MDGHGRDSEAAYAGQHHFGRPSAEKSVSVWSSRGNADNESEEELTGAGQRQHKGASGDIVKVTTFRVQEDRI
jgi:hypothetical protein